MYYLDSPRLEHKESRYFFLLDLPKKVSKCLHIDRINIQLKPICTTIGRRRSRAEPFYIPTLQS